ncbi:MAG: GAF domain-containing sensor histidine kinase [Candidatus Eisenbacteria bacterium]|uniref:histidine kinase n=1 Tax=Eiseniibacteriota bacterium TaxID=2212470 RepID=A0A538T6F0_UNCEI|nr:MAG: GAF domain-containing sensor histidine kinase [Candidatus Eisenbacteria bacterium]
MSRSKASLAQKQADHRTWALLGLVILVLLGFVFTVQTLWVSIVRSGFLGDNLPANGWMLLVGLVGLTVLFCLYIVHQQTKINQFRARLLNDQMELEQSRGRLAELTSLFQLGNSLHMDLPLDTILEITVRRVASTLHSHDVALFLFEPDRKALKCRARFGLTPKEPESEVRVGEGAVGWAARHREPVMMGATDREARFAEHFMAHPDAGSALILPVNFENRCVAVLQVHRAAKAETFRLEHRDIGQLFADNVAGVIDRALVVRHLEQRATDLKPSAKGGPEAQGVTPFQDSFLSSAENELKAPLTTILAYSEVLDQNDKRMTTSMRREFTARLRGEAQRLMNLVDDVLDLARLETGRFLLDLRKDNVNAISRAAVETVRTSAAGKQIDLEMKLDEKIPDQHVDAAKVRQAILHLLQNGIRFSPAKGRVTLTTWLGDDHIRIEVRDSGPAVEPEVAPLVFDIEAQGTEVSKRMKDGLGFGLHLTKRFVELHGGTVGVGASPSGTGATFWIRLPKGDGLESVIGRDPFLEQLWENP